MRQLKHRASRARTTCARTAFALVSGSIITASALTAVAGVGAADAHACANSGPAVNIPVISRFLPRGGSPSGPQKPMPAYDDGTTKTVSWVTGPLSQNQTLRRFGISGTDLGIAWDNGRGQTMLAFGDTFGNCLTADQQWRHNTLLRSDDPNLADGLHLSGGGHAGQMFGALGFDGVERTTIPTSGISIGGRQYVNYMSVRSWGPPSVWFTNYSATAVSSDDGRTWFTPQSTIRVNSGVTVPLPAGWPSMQAGDANFQQSAYTKGTGPDDGWVFQYGTPNGRFGSAYLARFRPTDILDLGKYQYWTGSNWAPSPDAARPVVPGRVTELSVSWSPYLQRYVMLDSPNGVLMRTAARPQGPWSPPRRIAPASLELYAPMMLPTSPALRGTGPELYFNASRWDDYNVLLARTVVR